MPPAGAARSGLTDETPGGAFRYDDDGVGRAGAAPVAAGATAGARRVDTLRVDTLRAGPVAGAVGGDLAPPVGLLGAAGGYAVLIRACAAPRGPRGRPLGVRGPVRVLGLIGGRGQFVRVPMW